MKIFLMETAGGQKIALFTELEMSKISAAAHGSNQGRCAETSHREEKKKRRWPWQRREDKLDAYSSSNRVSGNL